ncbi:MAG TPA: hypothetical protein PK156_29890 [Polyangium sp.]|nr:hypothetical protein [Polyangium sp.]
MTRCFQMIVVALTNLRWLVLAFALLNVGCGSGAIKLQSPETGAFAQLLHDEMTSDARRPAHGMAAFVRGNEQTLGVFDPEKLPEAYTPNGEEANRRYQFHLGYAAQRLIRAYYSAAHSQKSVLDRDELIEIVDAAGGDTAKVDAYDRDRHIDIADVQGRFVFEIVPFGLAHETAGKKKVDEQLSLINKAMSGGRMFQLGAGFSGEIGVRFAERAAPWSLVWSTNNGVVLYEWRALTVDKFTEDACQAAYLEDRWHVPSPEEMVRNARALHEVVERLVQAREALGRTRAATEMPMLSGKTAGDYLRSVRSWGAHDDELARLLPVMRRPPPAPEMPVRRDARFIGQTPGGSGGGDPQTYYTVKPRPGNQPWNLHIGNSAHNVIGTHYQNSHGGSVKVRINTVSIQSIVKDIGGTVALLRPDEALRRPDITDLDVRVVFEIKSTRPGQLEEGRADVAANIAGINRSMPRKLFSHGIGFTGDVWVRFDLSMRWWRLDWRTTEPGVVQYNWSKLNNDEVDEATIRKGVAEGRFAWVDLTQADVDKYAEACERWSEHYANGTQKLYMLQVAAGFVVEVIGTATMVWISPGLSPGNTAGKPAQPGTSPKPGQSLPPVKPSPTPASKPPKMWVPPPEPPRPPSGARIGDF